MKVKCINQHNYKDITVGNEYEVVEILEDFYHITANSGNVKSYNKKYFELVTEPVIEDVNEVGVVEEEEKEDVIIVEYVNTDGISISINGEIFNLNYYNVAGNCGVHSYNGVNYLFDSCKNDKELFKKSILAIIEVFEESNNGCMLIFSTNDEMYEIWEVLDEVMDMQSEAVNNPNSDMDVKLWIKYAYHERPDYNEEEY